VSLVVLVAVEEHVKLVEHEVVEQGMRERNWWG
jgi:hypothetical protein